MVDVNHQFATTDCPAVTALPHSISYTWPRQQPPLSPLLRSPMTSVKLYVYDLSQGMAKQMSLSLTGRQIGMYNAEEDFSCPGLETYTTEPFFRRYLAHVGHRFRPRILLWAGNHERHSR
jgi:hypothetical protein